MPVPQPPGPLYTSTSDPIARVLFELVEQFLRDRPRGQVWLFDFRDHAYPELAERIQENWVQFCNLVRSRLPYLVGLMTIFRLPERAETRIAIYPAPAPGPIEEEGTRPAIEEEGGFQVRPAIAARARDSHNQEETSVPPTTTMTPVDAPRIIRWCGTARVRGATYLVGPADAFQVVDPPVPFSTSFPQRGVTLIEDPQTGIVNIFDWIGERYYPNVADFIDEARLHGLSRRIRPENLHGSIAARLSAASRVFFVHPRGGITNWEAYRPPQLELLAPQPYWCPRGNEFHAAPVSGDRMCAGIWWEDYETRENHSAVPPTVTPLHPYRARPAGVTPQYVPAIVATFSVASLGIDLVADPNTVVTTAAWLHQRDAFPSTLVSRYRYCRR